jgi:hypothetical protein
VELTPRYVILLIAFSIVGMVFYYQNTNNTYSNMGVFSFEESPVSTKGSYTEATMNPIFACLAPFSACGPENRACKALILAGQDHATLELENSLADADKAPP